MRQGAKLRWLDRLALGLARVEPAGLSPKAPGTCGSAAAILLAPFLFMPLTLPWRGLVLAVLLLAGSWAAGKAEKILNEKDPGSVVIDEVLGQWLTLLPFADLDWKRLLLAFALFRLFDITKPPPIRAAENWFPGGLSVMLDDAIAGLYALLALWGLLRLAELALMVQ